MTHRTRNPLFLNRAEIERAAPSLQDIVAIIEDTYRADADGKTDVPTKTGVHPGRPNSFLHTMPAWVGTPSTMGVKLVTYYPGNFEHGLHDSTAIIILYDPEDGHPLAIMEGMWITFVRTVACAATAAKHLATPNPERLGLVGCGGLGQWSLRILTEVFPSIREVRVASRSSGSRDAFCARFAGAGSWAIHPAADTRDAVQGMDIVVSSTPQHPNPRLFERWWSPGTLAIPLDYPYAWDDAAYMACDALYADGMSTLEGYEATSRAGGTRPDLRLPTSRNSLQDLVAGRVAGRRHAKDRIMAIVTGIASTDVALAAEILLRAKNEGLGRELAFA